MRVAILQMAPEVGPGQVLDWLDWRGLHWRLYHLDEAPDIPMLDTFDLLIVLDGPLASGNTDAARRAAALIEPALAAGKRILGIGLGGHLIACALGAEPDGPATPDIGWKPVELHRSARQSPLGSMLPHRLVALHWTPWRFSLPRGAVPLYGSSGAGYQGFVWQERVVALPCHLQTKPADIERLLRIWPDAFSSRVTALRQSQGLCAALRTSCYRILDYLSGPHADLT
ncbi:type 1 glutamine amidotransferase [Pseudomonas sp. Marseille-QA0892]